MACKTSAMKQQEIKDILKKLENSVTQVFESEYYLKTYLTTLAKFHSYSFNNILWIYLQRPTASKVASYIDWERKFHRHVVKGSKGIKVLVPIKKKFVTQSEVTLEDGATALQENKYEKLYFKVGNVFDIADTTGEPLPSIVKILNFNSNFLKELINQMILSSPIPINITDKVDFGTSNGYYVLTSREIFIRNDLPDLQTLKTLLHELSHSYQETYHANETKDLNAGTKEVVAEATAYVTIELLREFYNMDALSSNDYSFGYIVSWSKNKELSELKSTLSLISTISNSLFDWISNLKIPNI